MAALRQVLEVTSLLHAGLMIHPGSITSRKVLPFVSGGGGGIKAGGGEEPAGQRDAARQ